MSFRSLIRWLFLYPVVALLSVSIAGTLLICVLIAQAYPGDGEALPADCGIVFGAAVSRSGRPSNALYRRIAKAVELYDAGEVERVIMTGGKARGSDVSESAVMRQEAVRLGMNPDDIAVEVESTSTLENLLYSKNYIEDCQTLVGISDGYHLARIELLARQAGYGSLPTIAADDTDSSRRTLVNSVIREIAAYWFYGLYLHRLYTEDIQW